MPDTDHIQSLYMRICRCGMRMNSSKRTPTLALKPVGGEILIHMQAGFALLSRASAQTLRLPPQHLPCGYCCSYSKALLITQPYCRIVRAQHQRLQH